MENQNNNEQNPFEGFLKNVDTSKEMSEQEAKANRQQLEQDAKDSEQAKRTDNQG